MNKSITLGIRLNENERQYLESVASKKGFIKLSHYARSILLNDYEPHKLDNISFATKRKNRYSFSCEDYLWIQILKKTKGTASDFIREAVMEKLTRISKSSE